ncbi:hypothetical protein J7E73_24820 [Paenibacillus albidus]|uniref:hypothetical protein n=1 Tax=Paenibacillus albidus TaxID=2041023 RepID=UPI001BED1EEF|nr:hypothetical protein [Paenibacillus albidus]MBT2292292.1 hypothetical protein [Paenibacillus albidus]
MNNKISGGFPVLVEESGEAGQAYMEMDQKHSQASVLDAKTDELAYIALLFGSKDAQRNFFSY